MINLTDSLKQINTSAINSRDSKYIEGIQPSQLSKTMNNTELNLKQLAEVSGARWADIRDHNHGKFMQRRRSNRKPIWTTGGTASVKTSGRVTSLLNDRQA